MSWMRYLQVPWLIAAAIVLPALLAMLALVDQRRARAAGRPVALPERPAFCGCCGLFIATGA